MDKKILKQGFINGKHISNQHDRNKHIWKNKTSNHKPNGRRKLTHPLVIYDLIQLQCAYNVAGSDYTMGWTSIPGSEKPLICSSNRLYRL